MLLFNRAGLTWRVSGVVINREGDKVKMGSVPRENSRGKLTCEKGGGACSLSRIDENHFLSQNTPYGSVCQKPNLALDYHYHLVEF